MLIFQNNTTTTKHAAILPTYRQKSETVGKQQNPWSSGIFPTYATSFLIEGGRGEPFAREPRAPAGALTQKYGLLCSLPSSH